MCDVVVYIFVVQYCLQVGVQQIDVVDWMYQGVDVMFEIDVVIGFQIGEVDWYIQFEGFLDGQWL